MPRIARGGEEHRPEPPREPRPHPEAPPRPTPAPEPPRPAQGAHGGGGGHPEAGHGGDGGGGPVASAAAAETQTVTGIGAGDTFQTEVEALKGETGAVALTGVFTRKTAPKAAGPWGVVYQDLEAGVQLIDAFANLNHAAAAMRDAHFHSAELVNSHKTPVFKPKG